MIEYFNEDCMAGMSKYPDNHFDLAIVDPPYGILNKTKRGGQRSPHKYKVRSAEYLFKERMVDNVRRLF